MPFANKRKYQLAMNNVKKRISTETFVQKEHDDSMTDEEEDLREELNRSEMKEFDFTTEEALQNIGELFALCAENVNTRYLSTFLYMILRYLKLSWRETESLLKAIGAMTIKSCHKWSQVGNSFTHALFLVEHDFISLSADLCDRRPPGVLF
jgi:hypothetical protein